MKEFKLLIASMVLTCFALFPVASLADDDLDVTMEILDDLAQLEGVVLQMPGPDGSDKGSAGGDDDGDDHEDEDGDDHEDQKDGFHDDDTESGEGEHDFGDGFTGGEDDGFEHDDEGDTDDDLEPGEDDAEGDDVDTDEFDDEEHDGEEGADEITDV